jgi:anti-sigma regulatory factor (Ser/Thr protein kinase)
MRPEGGPQNDDPPVTVADLDLPSIPAGADSLSGLRRIVRNWVRHTGLTEQQVDDLVLGVDEAAANVVEHAYPRTGGVLAIRARRLDDPARVEVIVADHGRWQPPGDPGNRGRGIDLIRRLADYAEIEPGDHGTVVRMTWTVPIY